MTLATIGRLDGVYRSAFDDDEPVRPFGAGLFARSGQSQTRPKNRFLKPAPLPERQAPKWGGERGFSTDIELKLLIGVGVALSVLGYGFVNLFLG